MIIAKEPNQKFLQQFMTPSILGAPSYHIDTPQVEVKLDQNESPLDWPNAVKDSVLKKLKERSWNRYPSPFGDELAAKIAKKIGVDPKNILLGPGSNYLIALMLQTLTKNISGSVIIARPSFALYEMQCIYEGIPFEVWNLNSNLEYDVSLLPNIGPGSLVIFASPNNPVGNVLSKKVFEQLLIEHPNALFIADEAYCEFADEPYTELLKSYSNLLLLRTISKTMGAAGVRLGYIIGAANLIELLRKPRVPYLINQFTLVAASEVIDNPDMARIFDDMVQNTIKERKRVWSSLMTESKRLNFVIKPSQANFLLLKWPSSKASTSAYQQLIQSGILVRNVSGAPGLDGCLRISIGTESQNDRLINAFLSMSPTPDR